MSDQAALVTLRREYALPNLQLVVRQDGTLFEYLVLRQTAPAIDRQFALARDLEFTEGEAVQMGEFWLDYYSEMAKQVSQRTS